MAWMPTRPPSSMSMLRLWRSSIRIPTIGIVSAAAPRSTTGSQAAFTTPAITRRSKWDDPQSDAMPGIQPGAARRQSRQRLRPQTLGCRPKVVGNGPTPAVDVDGDIFPVVVRLDLRTDVPLIYLVAQAGSLFARPARRRGGFPTLGGHRRSLCVPHASPFDACFCTWAFYYLLRSCATTKKGPHGGGQAERPWSTLCDLLRTIGRLDAETRQALAGHVFDN